MNEITIVPKIQGANVYFLFRNNGEEVKIITSGKYPVSSHKLTISEMNFVLENIMCYG